MGFPPTPAFIETCKHILSRVNAAGGLAFNANIKATGYYIHKVESDHLPSAHAA
jgi:hypothetical protein